MSSAELDQLVQKLLTPLTGNDPAGRWMRYERAFMEISKSREEDDPNLPMGEWERPMIKADWKKIAADCERMLHEDTKDFQVAAWLCDAWIRLYRMDGLQAGLDLISGLAEHYWINAWPSIEEGDSDRRVAPFIWMNSNLPLTVKLNIALLPAGGKREFPLSMLDWERAPVNGDDPSASDTLLSRAEVRESIKAADGAALQALASQSVQAQQSLRQLSALLDARLKQESPSLSKLQAATDAIQLAASSLLKEIPVPVVMAPITMTDAETVTATANETKSNSTPSAMSFSQSGNEFSNREQAYQALTSIAAFLEAIEPHSPTPYLIRRAVELGNMSLPELVRQASADAGSLDNFFSMLGISPKL